MKRNAVAPTIVVCALILAIAGLVVALKLRSDRGSAAPNSPATVTITATATPAATPVVTPTPTAGSSAPSTLPLSDFTVCTTPVVSCDTSEMRSQPEQIVLSGDGSNVRHRDQLDRLGR